MPPVETTTTGTNNSVSRSGVAQSPAAAQAQQAESQALENVANAEQQVGTGIEQQLQAKATGQDLISANAETGVNETKQLLSARQPIIDAAQREADAAEQARANYKFHDYWANKTTGDKIVTRVAMALNSLGNGILGIAGNDIADRVQKDVDLDFKRQEKELYSLEQTAKWKKEGVKDLYDRLQTELAHLKLTQSMAHEAVAAKAEAMMARAGIPMEVAKQSVIVAKAREAATQMRMEATQRYEQKVDRQSANTASNQLTTAKNQGGGVEADKNAANFEVLKQHGEKIANKLTSMAPSDIAAVNRVMNSEDFLDGKPILTTLASVLGKDAESGISDDAKAFLTDVRAAAEGLGRVQSGAAIGSVENKRFVRSFMPQQSDSPKALQQRAENIRKDIEARGKFLARPARNSAGETTTSDAKPTKDPAKVSRARQVLKDKSMSEKAKAGAKFYLESVGEAP